MSGQKPIQGLGRGFEALCLQMSFRRKGYTNATPDPSLEREKVEKKMRKEEKKKTHYGGEQNRKVKGGAKPRNPK